MIKSSQKGFTLIELLVVVAIIGILAAVGVVAYNGYTSSAKEKTTEMNFRNINKSLMIEFMKCELDSSNIIFNSHNCTNTNAPTTSLISNFINTGMNTKNPYSINSSAISSNPCNLGTVSITTPSKGNYSVNVYLPKTQKISSINIGTIWTPIKTNAKNMWTQVNTGCKNTWTQINTNATNKWKSAGP
jgi:type IV pilus assembly protein PilA